MMIIINLFRPVSTAISSIAVARSRKMGADGPVIRSNEARWKLVRTLALTVEILPELSGFVDRFGDAIDSFVVAARSANGF